MILRVLLAVRSRPGASSPADLLDPRGALQGEDVVLATAERTEEMLAHVRSRLCDLVVVDEALLAPDPRELVQDLRTSGERPQVVVLLAEEDAERRALFLEVGALGCVALAGEPEVLARGLRALVGRARDAAEREHLDPESRGESLLSDFASRSPVMRAFLKTVRKVVDADTSLLVLGETGVGKEHLARAIHAEGPRREGPFVAMSCAALSESLLESELFGHVAGAFTGALRARRGYFELAHRGTVFLDEIGELAPSLQVKLLRVLQDRRIQPVGSERTIEIDVRVVAATNRDLRRDIEVGRFRSDLYYRLGVVTLTVPSLRERREDIPDLVASHLVRFREVLRRPVGEVSDEALRALVGHGWPGNVRELINVMERAVLLADGARVELSDLPEELARGRPAGPPPRGDGSLGKVGEELFERPLAEAREAVVTGFERAYLERLLRRTGGRVGEAARQAGLTERSLYEKMRRLDLRKERFRTGGSGSSEPDFRNTTSETG